MGRRGAKMNSIFTNRFPSPRGILQAAIVIAAIACGSDSPVEPKATGPASLQTVLPLAIEGIVGTAVEPSPTVLVKDSAGNPLAGVRVEFAVGAGGGSVSSPFVLTNNAGLASVTWILGPSIDIRLSRNELWAQVVGLSPVRFTVVARGGPPARLVPLVPTNDTLVSGFKRRIFVQVYDAFGNRLANVAVRFNVTSGNGSVASDTTKTGTDGVAYTDWTLGIAGENSVTATVAGVESFIFRITALDPGTFIWYDLEGIVGSSESIQSASVGFDASGSFASQVVYAGGYTYSALGRYTLAGSSVVLYYRDDVGNVVYTETGVIENDQLVIAHVDYYNSPSTWTYKKRH
jgi:hypothetical protein